MSRLIFNAADVRRVVKHTLASKQSEIADWSTASEANEWTPQRSVPDEANVVLVHDDGVYLMSNGTPRDLIKKPARNGKGEHESSFVAHAAGTDPAKDPDWWDTARSLVGGDDFAEYLPWAREIKKMLDDGATEIVVNCRENELSLSALYPKRKTGNE